MPNLWRALGETRDRDRTDAHEREEHDGDVHQERVGRQSEQSGDLHVSLAPIFVSSSAVTVRTGLSAPAQRKVKDL